MNKFDIAIIPYRDIYFWEKYGSAVRDLQILEILNEMNIFENIYLINRPVSLYERIFNKRRPAKNYTDVKVIDKTSLDLFGPLRGRSWSRTCYNKLLSNIIKEYTQNNKNLIILDFSPFLLINVPRSKNIIFWHDMIDNFTKHNRFTNKEKLLVEDKYQHIANNYHMVTAVTKDALNSIPNRSHSLSRQVFSNGLFNSQFEIKNRMPTVYEKTFDFGFIGFITNKFDVDLISNLAKNHSIVIYGDSFDHTTTEHLKKAGAHIMGGFKYRDIPSIMKTFKIGLIPYLEEKSHDGSPLKMYEYLKHNKPCLTTINYDFECAFVVNVNTSANIESEIKRLLTASDNNIVSKSLPSEAHLKEKIHPIINSILQKFDQ